MARNAFRVLLALWAGSLCSLVWVASTMFHLLADPHAAGVVAARLFSIETYLGAGVALCAVLLPERRKLAGLYLAALLLACNEFILKQFMEAARAHGASLGLSFGAWHGVSAVLYLIACAGVLLVVWKHHFR